MLDSLTVPIVQAPMAGGPSTPALAAAVSHAGALGFLAAPLRPPEGVADDIAALRAAWDGPFGVNVFAPPRAPADPGALAAYRDALAPEFAAAGVEPGEPRFHDDAYAEKLELLLADPVAIVSFTFGCPSPETVAELQRAGSAVWVTVTEPADARVAAAAGVDALVVQGAEAGGHRGTFEDRDGAGEIGLLALLQLVAGTTDLPLVAAGGIATGAGVAAVLAAGARAAQVGTAFMRCPEAGTSELHRAALAGGGRTALTRAYSGRLARGVENRLMREHRDAPLGYPEILGMVGPLVADGRAAEDPERVNLWAGQAFALAPERPAGEVVAALARDAAAALDRAHRRWV